MRPITMFESADGKRFETEEECRAHEERIGVERVVNDYLDQLPENVRENPRSLARRANVARHFLSWYLINLDSLPEGIDKLQEIHDEDEGDEDEPEDEAA